MTLRTDRKEIHRHCQPDRGQKERHRRCWSRGMAARNVSAIQLSYEFQVMRTGENVQNDTRHNQRCAKPQ